MRINYAISRKVRQPHRKSRIEVRNGRLTIPGEFDWEQPEVHAQIKDLIFAAHPGWSIAGYCLAPVSKGVSA